ncbi:capsular polysaccharide biosynthesis protein [Paracoccus suum]|uniref:Capsular polysaccharide biosynthesis protein n=1 Tax=Paracoccus suum TaxID=2259340 RepID=A0A344PM17_9RHOB|nr:capsular polysaccharide biosynthesis protein [Paracoccus suum]AXC50422.1 capsular polysaccharide biosynthesis protein [Paracoccus suum]
MAQGGETTRRLCVYTAGFWRGPRLARILQLAGWHVALGLPREGDAVGGWGASPRAWRGAAVARRRNVPLVRIEDAFLRSVLPGRARGTLARRGPLGLLIDPVGLHFDPSAPSLIETLVTDGAAAGKVAEAEAMIARLQAADLSKYNAHDPAAAPALPPGYVLVIDQTRGDAALRGADAALFRTMLAAARTENPGQPILIRTHPETAAGLRPGHLTTADLRPGDALCDRPVSPWRLVRDAARVYAVSSQLGYEAMLSGHRPRLFGQPFYAGWDLSDDEPGEADLSRRGSASRAELFAASHLMAPVWYDPCRDRLTDCEGAVRQLEVEVEAFRQDRHGHLAYGMRLWKRGGIARAFGQGGRVRFTDRPSGKVTLVWANRAAALPPRPAPAGAKDGAASHLLQVEDGFLRSRGLGAALTPALSLVADDLGIYYDPTGPSRLEALIRAPLPPGGAARSEALIARLRAEGTSKYNLSGSAPEIVAAGRRVILVPGQVEDDASIRLGAGRVRTNLGLLAATRAENPHAFIVWKPHPDVEAGLRPGAVPAHALAGLADVTAPGANPAALLAQIDEVWTMTSTLGFEALIRGVPVVTLGAPFYAGWGLTRDLDTVPERRQSQHDGPAGRPDLRRLVHAALIAYPRYMDPRSHLPCPVEVALDRLADPSRPAGGPMLRLLAKAQGALASQAWLWR